jgi:hypothetical protein
MGLDQKFIVWKLAGGALKQLIFLLYILIGSHLLGHKKNLVPVWKVNGTNLSYKFGIHL